MNHKGPLRQIALLIVCASTTVLAACSSAFNPIGTNTYDCNRKQDPSSVYCRSFRAVEASTNGELPDTRFDKEMEFSAYDKATEIAPVTSGAESPLKSGSGNVLMTGSSGLPHLGTLQPPQQDGAPVREGPVIQRTWIKQFVDANDVLTADTVVYKEIIPTRWAGFNGGDPTGMQRGLYPHRAAETKQSSNVRPSTEPSVEPTQQTNFIQPGAQTPVDEHPRGSVSPTSMPQ
ncbi:TraV family lipoprotein [Pandoraea commovens]|uniref:TraV family lipoprotein n=1 Tax=Pandoraea commovens TaxID=2508289 RepID=A0ABY5Q9D9_9BURK|nr:TraV family lipoprotein [Pandoraea commovens]UVA77165.1 TraV family lipoprotein [Pandoraea commovens]